MLVQRSSGSKLIASALCAVLVAPVPALGAELPVRSVVLYKHGVGYFERGGTMGPGESARLDFNASEMNDVLKSLTITDSVGKVTGVRYDSSIPLASKLAEFPFQAGDNQPLSNMLDQLKGARVEMEFGPQKLVAVIAGARLIPGDKDRAEKEQVTLLTDSGDLRNVDLSAATSIRFPDVKLQTLFKDFLSALNGARSRDKRSVYIDSTDSKSREVRASYITPMPAWKSSYRLLFDEKGTEATLEGWAIADNTTGEDWTNVHISLVSGKPISFVSQLYGPKYIKREGAELPEDQAVAPTVHTGAVSYLLAPPAPAMARMGPATKQPGPPRPGFDRNGNVGSIAETVNVESSNVASEGHANEVADLFEYTIQNPVTVKKNESAMLPFLQRKIPARRLIIYSDDEKPNPLSAAEITNNSGRPMDGGPITIFDAGTYAGEALVETVKNSDKRFISYGVDLGTRISTNVNSERSNIREIHAHDGILESRYAQTEKKVYEIHNVDPKTKTLIVEHPIRRDFHLIGPVKPFETASDVYRFEVKLPANANTELIVTEEHLFAQTTSIITMMPEILAVQIRNKVLSDAARRQLQEIFDVKTQLAAAGAEKSRIEKDVQKVTSDEERNRQNIASLSGVGGQQQLVQEYARKLADQETQIAKIRERQTELDNQTAQLQGRLNGLIAKLEF